MANAGRLIGIGIIAGAILAMALRPVARALIFGVSATDVSDIGVAAGMLAAVSVLAALVPARRSRRNGPGRSSIQRRGSERRTPMPATPGHHKDMTSPRALCVFPIASYARVFAFFRIGSMLPVLGTPSEGGEKSACIHSGDWHSICSRQSRGTFIHLRPKGAFK